MKNIFFLSLFLVVAAFFSQTAKAQTEAQKIELCTKVAGGSTLLNSYSIQLPAAKDGERQTPLRQALAIRKGNKYRFTVCTDEDSASEAILTVYEEGKFLFSAQDSSGKIHQNVDFDCNKSAAYIISITFKDGKAGSAVVIVSHVKTL